MRRCIASCILSEVILLAKQRGCHVVKISSSAESSTWVDQDEEGCHQITQRQTRRHTHATDTDTDDGPSATNGVFQDFDLNFVVRHLARPNPVRGRVMCGFRKGQRRRGKGRGNQLGRGTEKTARRMREPSLRRCCHSPSFIIYN